MSVTSRGRRIVPVALGAAMLAVVIAAAISPNLGAVPAQTNNQYGQGGSSGLSPWLVGGIVAAVVVAALALAFLFLRRRRRPPATPTAPVQPWQGGPGPAAAPPVPPTPPPAAPLPPPAAPAYLETPEDVGQAPPTIPPAKGAAAAGTAAEAEPDIDSLMAELDKISGEILKRAPKKGAPPPTEPAEEEPPP